MSYESPIEMFYNDTIQNIAEQIRQETDDRIVCEVKMQCGVNIDKGELVKALKYDRDQYNKGYQDAMNDARATGEWIDNQNNSGGGINCSICGKMLPCTDEYWYETDYCPNCGAKMKGEEE